MASALEVLHFSGFFLAVGSMTVINLRVLGMAGRGHSVTKVAEQLFPWMWTGLSLAVVSGFLTFAGDSMEYVHNSVFYDKLYGILAAVLCAVALQWAIPQWDRPTGTPFAAKLMALACLFLWFGTILLGVNVPALTGVG